MQRIQAVLRSGKERWTFDLPIVQGVLSMKQVLAGSYQLTLRSQRFGDLELKAVVRPDLTTDLGMLKLVDLETAEGLVVDQDGRPLAGFWIGIDAKLAKLWPAYDLGQGVRPFEGRVLTESDKDGCFENPVKARLQIQAFKPGYAPGVFVWSQRIPEVETGSTKLVAAKRPRLMLRWAGELQVAIPGTKGSSWIVELRRIREVAGRDAIGASGPWKKRLRVPLGKQARFLGLEAGTYRLSAVNTAKSTKLAKKNVAGESYDRVIQIQTESSRRIEIP